MRLLICTQAVDKNDPILGFFHRWIEEFAKHSEQVTVISLRKGEYTLPPNVRVYALGPGNKLSRTMRFLRHIAVFRDEYSHVFVHMNPEYVVLGGLWWRIMGKRIGLWYSHKNVDLKLRLATLFSNIVFTASKESFRLRNAKVRIMGHGIDTDFFSPDPSVVRGGWALSVGRLMPSKRHDLAIRFALREGKELRIAGEGPERTHLGALASELGATVHFLGGISQLQLRDEYRKAAYLIHTSETGSLDKVVLEALACGLPIRTNDPALKSLEAEGPRHVREHHSLGRLIPAILDSIQAI